MKPTTAYLIGGVIALACIAAGIYYLIPTPGAAHFLASVPGKVDVTHAVGLFAVAVVALVAARFLANSKSA